MIAGVGHASKMFKRGIRICTGTGIGAALSTCIQSPNWQVTRNNVSWFFTKSHQVSHLDRVWPGENIWANNNRSNQQTHWSRKNDSLGLEKKRWTTRYDATSQGHLGEFRSRGYFHYFQHEGQRWDDARMPCRYRYSPPESKRKSLMYGNQLVCTHLAHCGTFET